MRETMLVIDDGGFITSNPDGSGFPIPFKTYVRVLELAKRHEIKIPIACTACFFDLDNISGVATPNPDADRLLKLFADNPHHLELWNHGLTHRLRDGYTEFLEYGSDPVPEAIQVLHLESSRQIFKQVGFNTEILVPPGHAWEQGVTDRLASELGFKVIAAREFEKAPMHLIVRNSAQRDLMKWTHSRYLETRFRLGLGLKFDQTTFSDWGLLRTTAYVRGAFWARLLLNRRLGLKYPVHHYFAHIQNFVDSSSDNFFDQVMSGIAESSVD